MCDSDDTIETNNLLRLIASGISPKDATEIAVDAAMCFDRNRKGKGAVSGALGATGREVYRTLAYTPDYEPDIEAFITLRPYTAELIAERVMMGRAAVGAAVNRLIEHGFLDRQREGRGFSIRLTIPNLALTELGEDWSSTEAGSNTLAFEHYRPLGDRVLSLYPR